MAYLQFFVFGFKGFLSTISPGAPEFHAGLEGERRPR